MNGLRAKSTMRKTAFSTLLVPAIVFGLLGGASAGSPERAILVREATIRIAPDENSAQVITAGRGRDVVIVDRTPGWLKIFGNVEQSVDLSGWVLDKGVVRLTTPGGDRILFGAGAEAEDQGSRTHGRPGAAQDAMRLYARLAEYFPQSPLAGEALYRSADIRWQIAYADTMSLPSAKESDPIMRSQIPEDYMRDVIKKFPRTKWADLAAYHLLDNKVCGDWQGRSKCPERETELYEKYVRAHPQSPKAPEALYSAAGRQSALIEIYKTENEAGRSSEARNKALALARRLVSEYGQSEWVNRATLLSYQIEQNIPTYGSAKE